MGEFIFDHSWADYAQRSLRINYYPKVCYLLFFIYFNCLFIHCICLLFFFHFTLPTIVFLFYLFFFYYLYEIFILV